MSRGIPTLLLATVMIGLFSLAPRTAQADITPLGQRGCASGTVVGGPNLVANGDFAVDGGFNSELPNRGRDVYPDDSGGGGYSIQTGPKNYGGGIVVGQPFPGDTQREVPATETYFYSNPNKGLDYTTPVYQGDGEVMLWSQQVQVSRGTTYNFFGYFDNLLVLEGTGVDPLIELRVDGVAAGPPVRVPKQPDSWMPIQFAFTTAPTGPDLTTVELAIYDLANDTFGDDFAMTQISLKQCVSGLGGALDARSGAPNGDGTYDITYTITLVNLGVDPLGLTNLQVTADLASTFAAAEGFAIIDLTSPTLTISPGFDGVANQQMLSGTDSLAPGTSATITLVVRVTPGTGPGGDGPFSLRIRVTAYAGTILVSDESTPGTNPDPDGSGDPREPDEDRPTVIDLTPDLNLPLLRR